ncbi:hypothetical protein DXT88_06190 [Herbaspirillum lusitanum]|uniref:hypothetical protein n=1 Tax=Herbaspirillum lusitanum TaxID=213312 RepID=UPI0022380EE4|nr:hypothetical protein [Herbaspirillum lusitanum]MCW5297762.1 hypothetical protein [Herbaspirillum lusitanum]
MPYTFSTQQLDKIKVLSDAAATAYKNDNSTKGAYAEVYQYIADVLVGKVDQVAGSAAPATLGADVQQVQLWFAGAARANAGEGPFSVLIREYTQAQGELRGMGRFTDAQMQTASNAVGLAALTDILDPDNGGALLSITNIADKDATAVGRVLFPDIPNSEKNPAWSGVVLFGMLGSDQTWRVYGPNGTYSDVTQCMDTGYAYQALNKALGVTALGNDGVLNLNFGEKDLDILGGMWNLQHGGNADTSTLSPGAVIATTIQESLGPLVEPLVGAQRVLSALAANYAACNAPSPPSPGEQTPADDQSSPQPSDSHQTIPGVPDGKDVLQVSPGNAASGNKLFVVFTC